VPVAVQQAYLLKPPKVLNEQRLNQTGSPRLRCSLRASGEALTDNNGNPNASTATASRRPFSDRLAASRSNERVYETQWAHEGSQLALTF
jgi:hypothetical protein